MADETPSPTPNQTPNETPNQTASTASVPAPAQPSRHEVAARVLRNAIRDVRFFVGLAAQPEVIALLPEQERGIAIALVVAENALKLLPPSA
jgi:hypothetical protein